MSGRQTDLDQALSALRLLQDTCTAAIDALKQPLSETQAALLPSRPACPVLQKDYQSLLTLIYTSTTKVTLVLRPSAPAPSAAIAPIKDLGTSVTSLATCASLFDLHGSTLASEARALARDVCEAARVLANMFAENAADDYLVRAGTVHDLVEKARRELPTDNIAAVKRRWKLDRGMIEDSMEEINAMVEEDGQDEDLGGEDFDDEWDELGFGPNKKMSEVELQRTRKVQTLARFVTLFHKRVVSDVLKGLSVASDSVGLNAALDALPPQSHALVLALEEVVATLYAPQNPPALAAAVIGLAESIHKLHSSIMSDTLLPLRNPTDLVENMRTLSVEDAKGVKDTKNPRRWFETCLAQIDNSAKAVDEMLTGESSNAT